MSRKQKILSFIKNHWRDAVIGALIGYILMRYVFK